MHQQRGFGTLRLFVAAFIAVLLIVGLWSAVYMANRPDGSSPNGRDEIRRKHAARLAESLAKVYLYQRQSVPITDSGFNAFAATGTQQSVADPITNLPYRFVEDQASMQVGNVTFGTDAACDGSGNEHMKGLITDNAPRSVAVAIKLEAGGFVCESRARN